MTTRVASRSGKPAKSVGQVVSLTVVDQGASSISNFGLSVLVAHGSNAREIGVFAIVITTYILGQGLVRSVTSDCLLTRSGATGGRRRRFEQGGYLFAFLAASALSVILLGVAAVVGRSFAVPFVIVAIGFPLMALQDFSRYIGISRHDPAYAIRLDVAWIVIFVVAVIGLRHAGLQSLPWLFGAWTAAGALVGLWTVPAFLSVRKAMQLLRFWIASEWSVGARFAGQFLVGTFGAYGVLYLLVFVISIEAIGLIKVAQLALAPVVVLFAGVQSALVSIVSRKMRENRRQAVRFLNYGAVLMTVTMAIWALAVYAAPTKDIADLFGHTWGQTRPFMLWIGFATAIGSISQAYLIGLRAMRSAKELLRLIIIMAPFLLVLPLVGGEVDGIRGVAVGIGIFYAIFAVIAWFVFVRSASRFEADEAAHPISGADESTTDVLAREGLVAPVSFAEMFARHRAVELILPAPVVNRHPAAEPVSLADLLARQGAVDPPNPIGTPTSENGAIPVSSADLLARQGAIEPATADNGTAADSDREPISFAAMLARQAKSEPITVAEMLDPRADSDGNDGNSKTHR